MILDLGLTDYETAYTLQREFVRKRQLGEIGDSVMLVEHESVFTIGRTGKKENLRVDESFLKKNGIKILSVDRGGDITFHGPGQLLVYPIIDLKDRKEDLHKYLRDLEGVAINFLSGYSIRGDRLPGKTGVWVDSRKIAFIGIAASNWVTYHGLSLNVNVDLGFFSMIYPCGMKEIEVTSLSSILGRPIPMSEAKESVFEALRDIFDLGEKFDAAETYATLA